MLYRYEFENNVGILVGLDDVIKDEFEAFMLELPFINDLERPIDTLAGTIDTLDGTISYFTEKGNRHFSKAILAIKKAAKSRGVNVVCINKEKDDIDILYEDKYQILAIR